MKELANGIKSFNDYFKKVVSFSNKKNICQALLFYIFYAAIGFLGVFLILICGGITAKFHLVNTNIKKLSLYLAYIIHFFQIIYAVSIFLTIIIQKKLYKTFKPYLFIFLGYKLFIFSVIYGLIIPTIFTFFKSFSDDSEKDLPISIRTT